HVSCLLRWRPNGTPQGGSGCCHPGYHYSRKSPSGSASITAAITSNGISRSSFKVTKLYFLLGYSSSQECGTRSMINMWVSGSLRLRSSREKYPSPLVSPYQAMALAPSPKPDL